MINEVKIKGDNCYSTSLQIVELVKAQVKSRTLSPGEKLPTIQEFAEILGASHYSVRQAFAKLSDDGILNTIRGTGTFVADASANPRTSEKKSRAFALVAALSGGGPSIILMHPTTTAGILDECKERRIKGRFFYHNIDITSCDEIVEELKGRPFDGLIWLYPTPSQQPIVKALYSRGIPIVTTSHSQYAANVPSVQCNEVGLGQMLGEHLMGRGCNKIISIGSRLPCDKQIYNASRDAGILTAFKNAGKVTPEIVEVYYEPGNQESYEAVLRTTIKNSSKKTCLLLASMNELHESLVKNPDEIASLLSKCEFVIATTEKNYHLLDPLGERMDFTVSIIPLERVGRMAVRKLVNLVDGEFENTITLVNQTFEKFDLSKKI
jgi:DNA-binding transcriptional regulator YhcF (GntR family)